RSVAQPATPVTGTCRAALSDYAATNLTGSSTTSTSYVNLPDAQVAFHQGGTKNLCAVVTFSGEAYAATGGTALLYVRGVLETGAVATPSEVQFSGEDDEAADGRWARSNTMTFVFPNVAAGNHIATIQWRSFDGGQVFMHQHTTVVEHG